MMCFFDSTAEFFREFTDRFGFSLMLVILTAGILLETCLEGKSERGKTCDKKRRNGWHHPSS